LYFVNAKIYQFETFYLQAIHKAHMENFTAFPIFPSCETRLVKRVSLDFSRFPGFTGPGQNASLIGIFPVEESDADWQPPNFGNCTTITERLQN
jgi:hypothetical protein